MSTENCTQAILLTGRRGVGKTTVCQAVAELARRRGYRPGGVITPALYACPEPVLSRACPERSRRVEGRSRRDSRGAKVGFEAVDVGSGERWPLARTDQELGGPRVGPYSFDSAGLARALRVLRRAATAGTGATNRRNSAVPCDLLMVDEIGPLELEQGEGFAPILDLVHWRSSRTCSAPAERETSFATPEGNSHGIELLPGEEPMPILIVVRPALLDQLFLHLRDIECTIFSVTEENRDELPLRIVEELWGDRHCCAVR